MIRRHKVPTTLALFAGLLAAFAKIQTDGSPDVGLPEKPVRLIACHCALDSPTSVWCSRSECLAFSAFHRFTCFVYAIRTRAKLAAASRLLTCQLVA